MKALETIESTNRFGDPLLLTESQRAIALQKPGAVEKWQAVLQHCGACERVTLSYLVLSNLLLLAFHRNLPEWGKYFLLHVAIGAGMLALASAAERWPSAAIHFVRHWYPFALFIYFFEELHHIVHLVFPRWFDHWLIAFDYALFGVHPTVWIEQFSSPALNDLMAFFYLTYYFYTVGLGAVLYARKEWQKYWTVITATALAYAMGYLIALVFPIEGPYHTLSALQHGPLASGPVTALMNIIQQFGRVHGAAFPSLHVAGSFVALLGAWRFERRLFRVFLPLFTAMCVSTVYGRYHYVADIFGGLMVGAVGFWIAQKREAKQSLSVKES